LLTAHNHVALDVVSRTDHIAVIPSQIARQACETWPLKILSSPVALGEFSLGLYWHLGTDKSPLHRWFREVMLHEAREAYFGSTPAPRRSR
jgi:DNA-binding transcriptional LysR family regulator